MNVRIVFRPSKINEDEGYLSLRVYYQRKSKQVATGLKLMKGEWDEKKCQIMLADFSSERRKYLKRVKSELENKVYHIERLLADSQNRGKTDIEHLIKSYKLTTSTNSFTSYVQVLADKLMEENRHRTSSAYLSTMRRVVRFNNQNDLSLDKITPDYVESFERHLYSQHLSLNTISFYMRNLRAIYNRAVVDKLLVMSVENPFSKVFTGVKSTAKRALTKEEINLVYSLDLEYVFKNKSKNQEQRDELEQSRDLFLFSFHTRGMSFVDIAMLKKTDLKNGVLSYCRKKTGQQLEVKISQALRRIINKYKKKTEDSPYVFPIINDKDKDTYKQYLSALSKQNKNLKIIQQLSGVTKNISSHVARHTWATIAKEENLPIWTISESLGHSSVKTTYIYLASINRTKLDEANEIVARAVGF